MEFGGSHLDDPSFTQKRHMDCKNKQKPENQQRMLLVWAGSLLRGQALVHPVTSERTTGTQAGQAMFMTQLIQLTYTVFFFPPFHPFLTQSTSVCG